ncbi:MAG: MotA/TolQ/ExbB proton channel family protein [Marinilabiliales bacterium]
MLFVTASNIYAQDDVEVMDASQVDQNGNVVQDDATVDSTNVSEDSTAVTEEDTTEEAATEQPVENEEKGQTMHQKVKQLFIEGGATFMSFVLLCLILGLALAIERIIYLNMASTNTEKLLKDVEDALNNNGIEAAKEVCRNTRGPVASIFYQGLDRYNPNDPGSLEAVEKSVIAYGGVQMGLLERNLSWISLFISLAPMLGFMGTVLGMIDAFNSIEIAGDVSPQLVASGIKVALITTVSGLIVAMILQVFYNYLVSKIDSIVNKMEDASISLVDILVKYNLK